MDRQVLTISLVVRSAITPEQSIELEKKLQDQISNFFLNIPIKIDSEQILQLQ